MKYFGLLIDGIDRPHHRQYYCIEFKWNSY